MQSQLIDKMLEIGQKRRRILAQMREAIRANNKDVVFDLATQTH